MSHAQTSALGPFVRYALWVQGCNKRCKGCISPDAQTLDGGNLVDVPELADEILSVPGIEGITVSGGEPFLQQDALCELIDLIREKRNLGVIVYTGMLYAEVMDTPLARRCDLIIDGEYIDALNDDKSLRGSSNQNVICITDRYRKVVDLYYGQPSRKVEFRITSTGMDMVGIPSKSQAQAIFKHDKEV